ncbi:hypothetical protein SDJN02_23328, partial [Cucurbita argyrosperma subsp. argyrosperma]
METATMEPTEKAATGLNCEAMDCLSERLSLQSPISDELHFRSVIVKNRRRAYLNKLICDGHSYSDHETGKIRDDASANELMMIRDEMMNATKRLG